MPDVTKPMRLFLQCMYVCIGVCVHLLCRFQDAAPASLYKQAGYVSDKADTFLVRLLGLDRRYLMKKQQK